MIERIQEILKEKRLSPSQFADEIKVQRSGMSHILSGRNKPSLDFVTKILTSYPDVNSDWLLFGKGKMTEESAASIFEEPIVENSDRYKNTSSHKPGKISSQDVRNKKNVAFPPNEDKTSNSSEIEKIVVFFKNKTYREFILGS